MDDFGDMGAQPGLMRFDELLKNHEINVSRVLGVEFLKIRIFQNFKILKILIFLEILVF